MISLAMPTYNGEKYLREQLDSIYAQTMIPDEVVVVDDCSTDGTVDILKEYHERYGLKYYINEHNIGYNKNFEKAITLCSGDYIALCDQDDIWLPTKIEKSVNVITKYKNEPCLVSVYSSSSPRLMTKGVGNKRKSGDWRLNFTILATQGCTIVFNKELKDILVPFPETMMYDSYIGFTASLVGNRQYLGEELLYYRIHNNNSFTGKNTRTFLERLKKNLYKYVPCWFYYDRYKELKYIKDRFKIKAIESHLKYLDRILSIYETNKLNRIFLFCSIKEIPLRNKIVTSLMLVIKIVLNIKDKY